MSRPRYGVVVVLSTLALVGVAVVAYARLADRPRPALSEMVGEASDTFAVRGVRDIKPGTEAYRRFAVEDSIWRARNDLMLRRWQTALGAVWHPSARQLVQDSAYHLVQANRFADAADLLGRWLATHPGDDDLRVEHARLLAQSARTDDALAEYARAVDRRPGDRALRDEYAAALLQARRYADAAVQYRRLLTSDDESVGYRLGLARALAWGEQARNAEPLLRGLVRSLPGDTTVLAMLHSVRASIDPTADEAALWVADEPNFLPYRLAYARSLVGALRAAAAAAQFDTLLMAGETAALLREAAGAHAAIPDSVGSARLLGRAVALVPSDTAMRRTYARALSWAGDRRAAIDQLGILIRDEPNADDLLMRGRLYLWSGDQNRAEPDLVSSARMSPRAETFALLGDMLRWRGEWRRARVAYRQALTLRPHDPALLASIDLLDRQERLAMAGSSDGALPGWLATARHEEDNTGYLFVAAGVSRGFAVARGTVLSLGVEQRRVSQRDARGGERFLFGYALEGGADQMFWRAHLAARAGIVRHALVRDMPYGSAELSLPLGRTRVSLAVSDGPAYSSLMTTRAILPRREDVFGAARPLRGREAIVGASTPIGSAEVFVSAGALQLSDGNQRHSVQASVRVPLAPHVAALYSGGSLGFSQRSDAYWNPSRYVSHSVGVEVSVRKPTGFSGAARLLPGYGRSQESLAATATPPVRLEPRNVPQLSASYEMGWQSRRWRVLVDGSYGRGREGGYQSLTSNARVQLDW
jgi:tetratricopeptide (TPR) repeat protein